MVAKTPATNASFSLPSEYRASMEYPDVLRVEDLLLGSTISQRLTHAVTAGKPASGQADHHQVVVHNDYMEADGAGFRYRAPRRDGEPSAATAPSA
ncbi:hypothetical protein ACIHCV_37970 [Streptomyces sp. NPDC051956]|uniref:hypothetical protein n=1 Tax=Streptomyces sp. NPDC051956 TaxID=3365677 RepID=UPI0037D30967